MRVLCLFIIFASIYIFTAKADTIQVNALIRDFWPADANGNCVSIDQCGQNVYNGHSFTCICSFLIKSINR